MKKILTITIFALATVFIFNTTVDAQILDAFYVGANTTTGVCPENSLFGDPGNSNCVGYWIQLILDIIRYLAVALLIILSSMDFIKAVAAQEAEALQKALKTSIKRLIFTVIIFFLPIIIKALFTLLDFYSTTGDVFQGIK